MTITEQLLALADECERRVALVMGDFASITQLALRQQATARAFKPLSLCAFVC